MDPKTKYGLIYQRPGNCDRARSHEEVAKDSGGGVESGLSVKKPLREYQDVYGIVLGMSDD